MWEAHGHYMTNSQGFVACARSCLPSVGHERDCRLRMYAATIRTIDGSRVHVCSFGNVFGNSIVCLHG